MINIPVSRDFITKVIFFPANINLGLIIIFQLHGKTEHNSS